MDRLLSKGDIPSTILPLLRKPQGPLMQWADQGVRLREGECEGVERCDLYGKGGSQISCWAPLEDKPGEYPDLLKRSLQTASSLNRTLSNLKGACRKGSC